MNKLRTEQFLLFTIRELGFDNKIEVIENLYFKSIIDSFAKIPLGTLVKKLENNLRDRVIYDLENDDTTLIYELIQECTLNLTTEGRTHIMQADEGRVDIEFFISGFRFIVECKLLKSPDKKYVDEGLQRFISRKYAKEDDYAGMIGFIIKGEPEKIVEKLKNKVKKVSPTPDIQTYLDKTCANHNLSFQSKYIRSDNTEIHIFHVFFDAR